MSDWIVERVAQAIFDAENDWRRMEGDAVLPERHFKVAMSYYLSLANAALDAAGMQIPERPEQLIKRAKAAAVAGVSASTLKRAESAKGAAQLTPVKVGSRDTSYKMSELRRWMLRRQLQNGQWTARA